MNNPSFLMVLTATGSFAYQREDGVYVVPIGRLKNKSFWVIYFFLYLKT